MDSFRHTVCNFTQNIDLRCFVARPFFVVNSRTFACKIFWTKMCECKKITTMRYDGETTSNCSSFSGLKVEKSPLQWYVCGGKPVRWAKWPSASLILKQCECQEETIGCEKQIWKSIFTGKTWIFRKLKKRLMFILHFRLFWAYYFFMKFNFFGWDD